MCDNSNIPETEKRFKNYTVREMHHREVYKIDITTNKKGLVCDCDMFFDGELCLEEELFCGRCLEQKLKLFFPQYDVPGSENEEDIARICNISND